MDKVSPWKHQRALDTIYLKTFRLQGKARSAAEKWRLLSLLWSCTDDAALQLWGFSFLLFWQVYWLSLFMNLLALHQSQWPRFGPWVLNVNSNDSGWHEVLRVSSKWVQTHFWSINHQQSKTYQKNAKTKLQGQWAATNKDKLTKAQKANPQRNKLHIWVRVTHSQRGYSPPVWWIKLAAFCSILKDLPQLSSPDGHA